MSNPLKPLVAEFRELVLSKYEKPATGIPKTDFSSDVQLSLGKADTAIQQHQSIKTIDGTSIVGTGNIATRYQFTQAVASDEWTIIHNLGKYPSVTVTDSGNNVVIGEIQYINNNSLVVRFGSAFSGNAYLN